jgi:hypothetical protein
MFLLPLLALQLPQLADLNQKVTLDMRAVPGSALVKELSRKTGITFEAQDAAATDRYLVTVREVPLTQLMDKLAEAETGVWLHAGDNEYRLVRDRKKIEKEQNDERENSIKRITKAFEQFRKDLGLIDDFNRDKANEIALKVRQLGPQPTNYPEASSYWSRRDDLELKLPVQRFLERVILDFTPEQLADVEARTRTVYALNPTAMQRPLPPDATDAIGELAKEQLYYEEAVAKYLPIRIDEAFGHLITPGHSTQISNAIFAFSKEVDGGYPLAEVTIVDARGHNLGYSYQAVDPSSDSPEPPGKPTLPPKPEPPIPLSQSDIDMAMLFKNTDRDGTKIVTAVSESIRRAVANPTKVDPFNTFATDIIEGFAASRKQNVVAVLDDRILQSLAGGVTQRGFDPLKIGNVGLAGAEALDFGSGFFDMREQRPDRSDKVNCNRASLEEMITGAISAGHLGVKLAAHFAAPLERFDTNTIPDVYIAVLLGQDGAHALTRNDPDLLRFYGLLDGKHRKGSSVFLAGMTGEAGYLLDKIIYSDKNYLQIHVPPQAPGEQGDPWVGQTDAEEPTVLLGGGVPTGSYLTINPKIERALVAHIRYGVVDPGNRFFSPSWLAKTLVDSENHEGSAQLIGMAAANQEMIKLNFEFTSTTEMNLVLSSYWAASRETTSPNELPDDVRRPFLDELAQARKYQGVLSGGKNSNNGPP